MWRALLWRTTPELKLKALCTCPGALALMIGKHHCEIVEYIYYYLAYCAIVVRRRMHSRLRAASGDWAQVTA